jgi:hypothetical protein
LPFLSTAGKPFLAGKPFPAENRAGQKTGF